MVNMNDVSSWAKRTADLQLKHHCTDNVQEQQESSLAAFTHMPLVSTQIGSAHCPSTQTFIDMTQLLSLCSSTTSRAGQSVHFRRTVRQ